MNKIKYSGADLFSVVWNSPWFEKPKRIWYTPEDINSLKDLLHTFLSSHNKIERHLNIPKSTYARLWRKIVTQTSLEKIIKVSEFAPFTIMEE